MKTFKPFLTTLLILSISRLSAQENMHISQQLLYGTIRIEAVNNDGTTSTGTGFFFNFKTGLPNGMVNVIITNKHVVNGSKSIKLFFKQAINNLPVDGPAYIVTIPNNSTTVLQHPDAQIDLVAIPTNKIYTDLAVKNIGIFDIATDESRIGTDAVLKTELKAIEDVLMIGYPRGLWDMSNNFPIVRRGMTATAPYTDFNGKKEFLIDIAAFGGSSGSPVYFFRDIYLDKNYVPKVDLKLFLLGIMFAGPQYSMEGNVIVVKPIESLDTNRKTVTNIPMNLGIVIKATEILKFRSVLGI